MTADVAFRARLPFILISAMYRRYAFDDYSLLKNNTDFVHWYPARAWFEDAAPKENNLPEKSEAYNDVGYYILKSDEVYALIICGPIGTWGLGGHTHDDRLSFVLNLYGLPFLVDPTTPIPQALALG